MTVRDRRHGKPAQGRQTATGGRKICIAFDEDVFAKISQHQRDAHLGSFGETVRSLIAYAFDRLAADDMLDGIECFKTTFDEELDVRISAIKVADLYAGQPPVAPDPAPEPSPQPWGPYCITGYPSIGTVIPMPWHEGSIYGLIAPQRPPPTCQPYTERPPATGGEARSSGITGVAHDDTDERTRDS